MVWILVVLKVGQFKSSINSRFTSYLPVILPAPGT